jgi:hypothetical protein
MRGLSGDYLGVLVATVGFICSSYFVSISFSLSFAEESSPARIPLFFISASVTTWAFSMHGVAAYYWQKNRLIFTGLVVIIAMTIVYQFHGWAGYMAELNATFESKSSYAKQTQQLIQTQKDQYDAARSLGGNSAKIATEIDALHRENTFLISQRQKCKKGDWSCKVSIDQKRTSNESQITLKTKELERAHESAKSIDRIGQGLSDTLAKTLNSDLDYHLAHPVFQKMSYALVNSPTKAMIYQGRALGFLALLLTILEFELPFYCSTLCFTKAVKTKQTTSVAARRPPFTASVSEQYQGTAAGFTAVLRGAREDRSEPNAMANSEPTQNQPLGSETVGVAGFRTGVGRKLTEIATPDFVYHLPKAKYEALVKLVKSESPQVMFGEAVSKKKINKCCGVGFSKGTAIVWQLYEDKIIDEYGRVIK